MVFGVCTFNVLLHKVVKYVIISTRKCIVVEDRYIRFNYTEGKYSDVNNFVKNLKEDKVKAYR